MPMTTHTPPPPLGHVIVTKVHSSLGLWLCATELRDRANFTALLS